MLQQNGKFIRTSLITAFSLAPVIASGAENTITLEDSALICAIDNVYGVFEGSTFIPNPDTHLYEDRPILLTIPKKEDRVFQDKRGWALWVENANAENGFSSASHAFNEADLEWYLNYTYLSENA